MSTSAAHARTALGRPLRRERLDERYPDLDLWVDECVDLTDLRLPDPAAPAYPLCRWAELEGPLTYLSESPVVGHASLAAAWLDCPCRMCREGGR